MNYQQRITLALFIYMVILPALMNWCSGQVTNSALAGTPTKKAGQPKLIRTLGSNEYESFCSGLQDKTGNLWFGTSGEGVYRFDGNLFTQFTMADGLPSNTVQSMVEDSAGNIWLGTAGGLCVYDGKKMVPVVIPLYIRPVINNNSYYTDQSTKEKVWSMLQDKNGILWIGTGDGMYCYDGKKFTRFLNDFTIVNSNQLQLKMVTSILQDRKGNLWFASGMPPGEEGICRYDGHALTHVKPKNEGWFRTITADKKGNLLFATRKTGVLSFDLSSPDFNEQAFLNFPQPAALLNGSLSTVIKDSTGNTWFGSDYGKNMGDSLGGAWCYKKNTDTGEQAFIKITNLDVHFMMTDNDNNIWLGTRGTGLYRYDGKTITCLSK